MHSEDRNGIGTVMPGEKDKEICINLYINMFCMDQTLRHIIEIIGTILIPVPLRNNRTKKVFDVVTDIHSRRVLPGVDKSDLHVRRDYQFITIKSLMVNER
jgi:hypothetical protein